MPLENINQPEIIQISETLRLRKYDGNYEAALNGYRDPYVYQNSEGIFDEAKKPDLSYVEGMFKYLDRVGEAYFIEVLKDGEYISVGDVTVKAENPPIAIWYAEYRGTGIGTAVMKTVIQRLKELGYDKITGSTVYKWNAPSLHMHQKLGFRIVSEDEKEYILELELK
ncbi:MAG: GNAT family N-acetyltransferase [Candidatus Avispirillum sp.]